MSKNKVKVWLARDKSGELWLYQSIPNRDADEWFCKASCCKIDSSKFPSVKWEDDEPTEAYITLTEPQEYPKKETTKFKYTCKKLNQLRLTIIKLLLCMAGLFVSTIVFNHVTAWGGVALSALSLAYAVKIISNIFNQQTKQDNEK